MASRSSHQGKICKSLLKAMTSSVKRPGLLLMRIAITTRHACIKMSKANTINYLKDEDILKFLDWESLIPAIEGVLSDISKKEETETIQPARLIMPIPKKSGAVLCMPSFSGKRNILGCKVVSSFKNNVNKGLPSIFGTVVLLNPDTGEVKMLMEGVALTAWRTAAASVVATRHLHRGTHTVLAIMGAGAQAKSHAQAMIHYFSFPEVRVWNRTYEKAELLCRELGPQSMPYRSQEECVRGADVIVTTTYATEPIVQADWLKPGTHINAIGFGVNHHSELSMDVYKQAVVAVDSMAGAAKELNGLTQAGISLWELGELINGIRTLPSDKQFTVFHSMGMSLEDVITAELIYTKYIEERDKN